MPDVENGTSESLTVESVATDFESLLSEEPEYQETNESQPTQKQAPESESEDGEVEPSTEQGQPAEDETEPNEQTDEEQTEESIAASLDPNLKVKVKVDGEEQEITLAEALKGYSREAVFTRRMQEVAEQRKAVAQIDQQLRGERELYATQLRQLEQVFEQQTPKEPDWATIQRDHPDEFPTMWAQYQQYTQRMDAIRKQAAEAEQVVQRDRAQALKEHLQAERTKLLEAIPEWRKDEGKASAERQKIATYAREKVGFTAEELAELRDHRGLVVLRKAMMWDELQAKKPEISQRIETVRAATPGAASNRPRPNKANEAFARLAKTGSQEDFAAGLMHILED
jgi:hypothetical protein